MAQRVPPLTHKDTGAEMSDAVRAERLKARLYSYAPIQSTGNPTALKFKGVTSAQAKRLGAPVGPKIEPLVSSSSLSLCVPL